MSYVQRVLQSGEEIRHNASIHWIVYWPGMFFLLLACAVLIYEQAQRGGRFWLGVAGLLGVVAVVLLLREWLTWWTTEIAVTNRRVIYKEGFISRQTNEMNMDKVESVRVDQSVLGRLLDYGDVTILGTGEGFKTLKTIAGPLQLRNHITGV